MSRPEHRAAPRRGRRAPSAAGLSLAVTATAIALGVSLTQGPTTTPTVSVGTPTVEAVPAPAASADAPTAATPPRATTEVSRSFDRARHSTTKSSSPWVVVNKRFGLDPTYTPRLTTVRGVQVAAAAGPDLERMLTAADELGLGLSVVSGHRSYSRQEVVYSRAVANRGTAGADAVSARPGHSEHQTGLAVDVTTSAAPDCTLFPCFGETDAGQWVAREGWRYGFIVRYTGTNRDVTGFAREPWHLRWVGRPLAREMRRAGAGSLEEFLDVPGGDYVEER